MSDAQKIIDSVIEEYQMISRRNILEAAIQKEKAERLEVEVDGLQRAIQQLRSREINVQEETEDGS